MPSPNIVVYSDFGPIIININDLFIGRAIIETGYWETSEIKLIFALLDHVRQSKDRLTVYDVGANIGTHSLALAKHFGNSIRIRAFEAQRAIFHMLNGTLALNGLLSVSSYNVAVSDQKDELISVALPNYNAPNNFGGLELMPTRLSDNQSMLRSENENISTIILDDFDEAVDFIKMDIEGMEDRALRGATRIFDTHRPLAFIEIIKTDRDFVVDYFKRRDYRGLKIAANLLAIPKELNIEIKNTEPYF